MTMHYRARDLLDFIGRLEAPEGYDQVYGGSKLWPERPITTMTIDEVLAWQDASVRAGSISSAAGRFQIIRGTLRDLVRRLKLDGSERFDQDMQDRLAFVLLRQARWDRYVTGLITEVQFGNKVAAVWASLPMLSGAKMGRSKYDGLAGNSALCSVEDYRRALRGFA